MRPMLWGENRWLCSVCGEVEYSPEPPTTCSVCSASGDTTRSPADLLVQVAGD